MSLLIDFAPVTNYERSRAVPVAAFIKAWRIAAARSILTVCARSTRAVRFDYGGLYRRGKCSGRFAIEEIEFGKI